MAVCDGGTKSAEGTSSGTMTQGVPANIEDGPLSALQICGGHPSLEQTDLHLRDGIVWFMGNGLHKRKFATNLTANSEAR